ncbi:MAG: hypothetical protein AAF355_08520 [Myxococcota bacterium]
MLPPFIIDQIRQREENESREGERPRLELPLPVFPAGESPEELPSGGGSVERGVVIIDLFA